MFCFDGFGKVPKSELGPAVHEFPESELGVARIKPSRLPNVAVGLFVVAEPGNGRVNPLIKSEDRQDENPNENQRCKSRKILSGKP